MAPPGKMRVETSAGGVARSRTAAIVTPGAQAHAETVVPMQGQTPQQVQADTDACAPDVAGAADTANYRLPMEGS